MSTWVVNEKDGLAVKALTVTYGNVVAVDRLSFVAPAGMVTAFLGSNGAGKSSLLSAIMGTIPSKSDRIDLLRDGHHCSLQDMQVEIRAQSGLRLVKDAGVSDVFLKLCVRDNLRAGAYLCRNRRAVDRAITAVLDRFPRLIPCLHRPAGTLSGGELRMLSVAMALMGRPRVLLLDEPSSGLAPALFAELLDTIRVVARDGAAVVLAEQNAADTLRITDREYVLENGRVTRTGDSGRHVQIEEIARAYIPGSEQE